MTMNVTIDADNSIYKARNRAYIVRYNHHCHSLVQLLYEGIKLLLEGVIHKIGRLVKNK